MKSRLEHYLEAVKKKTEAIDVDDVMSELEEKHNEFVSLSLTSNQKKELAQKYKSGKYRFIFKVFDMEDGKAERVNNFIGKKKKEGYKTFMRDDNMDQVAVVLYKAK